MLSVGDPVEVCREVQERGEFADAFELCAQRFAWMQQMSDLRIAAFLTMSLNQTYFNMTNLLCVALQEACSNFDSGSYEKVRTPASPPVNLFPSKSTCMLQGEEADVTFCITSHYLRKPTHSASTLNWPLQVAKY